MTWEEMAAIEPKLLTLLEKAQSYKSREGFCANKIWYGPNGLRQKLTRLVGFGASKRQLRTAQAYDLAYSKIYNALPDCQHDGYC